MKKEKKSRADHLVHEQGLAESREQAKRMIMAGEVFILDSGGRHRVDKPGRPLAADTSLEIKDRPRFVSRGGYKLLSALETFDVQVESMVCLDVGASTGGFTHCLLQHGAGRVYALDVGYGQLHARLRNDPRVVCLEKINIRTADPEIIPEAVDLVCIDCSFISLKLVMPGALRFLKPGGQVIALVKPQFEVGRGQAPKGVVRSRAAALDAVQDVVDGIVLDAGLEYRGMVPSRITGPKGNQEYLVHFSG